MGVVKAGRGSPVPDVNKDVGSAATPPTPPAALPASHMRCAQAGAPLLPFLEARTAEPVAAARPPELLDELFL